MTASEMTASDPIRRLQAFIDERWAVAQPKFYPDIEGPSVRFDEVTPREAEYFLASITADGSESPLFVVDDDRRLRSDRHPPLSNGGLRSFHFFEAPGRLRLETIVHVAAMARLRDEFGWPREHLIFESPDVVDEGGNLILGGSALDVLALEKPYVPLPSKMTVAATRTRVAVEAKADERLLDGLFAKMGACKGEVHAEHNKCRAMEVFHPRLFLGVAAGEDWRLFDVEERQGRVVLGEPRGLDWLHFNR